MNKEAATKPEEMDVFGAIQNPEVKKNLEVLNELLKTCKPEEFIKKVSKEFNVPQKNLKAVLKNFRLNGQPVV